MLDKLKKMLLSIPHISMLFDKRLHERYEPYDHLPIAIESGTTRIEGNIHDISVGGMKILTDDRRIEDMKIISLTTGDFRIDLPCKSKKRIDSYYCIEFDEIDTQTYTQLKYFIDHYTKIPEKSGPDEIFR